MSLKKKIKKQFRGLSFRLDDSFLRNLVIVLGVILVWRGIWNLVDLYFLPENWELSNWISVVIGLLMLFMLDGTIKELGDYEANDDK